MGKLLQCPVPLNINTQWQTDVRPRLLGDLQSVLQSLPRSLPREKTIVEPDFCMVGKALAGSNMIEMKPTVLVRCGSKRCQKAITDAVSDLTYLKRFSGDRIMVHRRPPRLASTPLDDAGVDSDIPVERTDDENADRWIEVGLTADQSACGLRMRISYSGNERMCTLGGLIRVDGKIYGLTTAHAMVSIAEQTLTDTSTEYESDTYCSSISSVSSAPSSTATSIPKVDAAATEQHEVSRPIAPDLDRLAWRCANLGPYSYATERRPTATNNAYAVSDATDLALIELPEELELLPNVYHLHDRGQDFTQTVTTADPVSSDHVDRRVSIICAPSDVRQGYLLPGDHLFLDRSTVFSTRKIQTDDILREFMTTISIECL